MLQRSKSLWALGVLLALLALLVTISYAQDPEPYPTHTPGPAEGPEQGSVHEFHSGDENDDSPKELKYRAIQILEGHVDPENLSLDDPIRKAIEHIRESLEPNLWETDWSLTSKGKIVFDEEKGAVEELMTILEATDAQPVLRDHTLVAIGYLTAADRTLASTAIEQAIARAQEAGCYTTDSHNTKCQKLLHKIASAQKEMVRAEEEMESRKYDKAIDRYKKAWQHVQFDERWLYGFVQSMPDPEGRFTGTWVVVGDSGFVATFVAEASTEFKENHGPLEVRAYVRVTYYVLDGVNYATKIETDKYYVSGQVIAHLKPEADVAGIHDDYNALTLGRLLDRVYLLSLQPGTNERDTVDNMRNDSRIEYAEPNLLGEAPEASGYEIGAWAGYDPAPGMDQYANEHLDLPLARELSTGSGMVVAVLDTGVQLDHPALAPHLVAGYDFVDNDTMPADEGNGLDDDGDELVDETVGHGTHVAGIVLLVAPESQIMPLRVLNSDGVGSVFDVAEAMIYATDQGAQVINMSLGTSLQSGVLQEAADYARSAGVMIVAAAGNLNSTEPQYPAADEGVIAVAAVDEQRLKTSFSNYGSWVDLSAPGESIYSTFPADGYGWWSGTSMATPFVSGQIALLRSLAPWLTLAEMEGQMMDKVQNLDELNPDYAGQLGAGEPDVAASLGCHWADLEPDATHNLLNNTCDDDVDIADVMVVAVQWDQSQPPGSVYDNDHDGDVDIVDIMRVASWWNWTRQ